MSDFEYLWKCHSNAVKNGFGTKLDDSNFANYHHQILNRLFVDVHYNRKYLKYERFDDGNDNDKKEKFDHVNAGSLKCECTGDQRMKVSECPFIEYVIGELQKYAKIKNFELTETNISQFDDLQLHKALDHLINVHSFCKDSKQRNTIKDYVQSKLNGECEHRLQCPVLHSFTNRTRERSKNRENKIQKKDPKISMILNTLSSLHCHLLHKSDSFRSNVNESNNKFGSSVQSKHSLKFMDDFDTLFERIMEFEESNDKFEEMIFFINHINAWSKHNDFDFYALIADLIETDSKQSVFYEFLCSIDKQIYFEKIYVALDQMIKNNEKNEIDALKAHIRNNSEFDSTQIYRFYQWIKEKEIDWNKLTEKETESEILNEFGEKVFDKAISFVKQQNEKKTEIAAINFGVSVHEWLRYGEKPKFECFKDEMIDKLGEDLYGEYRVKCIALMNIFADPWILKEIMSVKVYTDTTDLCKLFRWVHWEGNDDQKREFFWWALTLFMAVQYHKKPLIKKSADNPIPIALYHGLSDIFVVKNGCPFYNGPISTTSAKNVGEQFCQSGLLWFILSSYCNPYRRVSGLSVERISCFPEESETLLCNSHLPISKTVNLSNDDNAKINLFMKQIQSYEQNEINASNFYKNIGFNIKAIKNWKMMIKEHKLLYEPLTHFEEKMVIHRLAKDFNLRQFDVQYIILTSKFVQNETIKLFNNGYILQFDKKYADYFKECKYIINYSANKAEVFKFDQQIYADSNVSISVSSSSVFGTKQEFEIQKIRSSENRNMSAADLLYYDFDNHSMKLKGDSSHAYKNKEIVQAIYGAKYQTLSVESPFNKHSEMKYDESYECGLNDLEIPVIVKQFDNGYCAQLMVQPFDYKKVSKNANTEVLEYQSNLDENGIFYALGSNFGSAKYENPLKVERVRVTTSDNKSNNKSKCLVGRNEADFLIKGSNQNPPFFYVNIGKYGLKPNKYTLRNSKKEYGFMLNWSLSASNDGIDWIPLRVHVNDVKLKSVGMAGLYEVGMWDISQKEANDYFSFFKIELIGTNHSGKWEFGCCGFEIYGETIDKFDYFYHDPFHLKTFSCRNYQCIMRDTIHINQRIETNGSFLVESAASIVIENGGSIETGPIVPIHYEYEHDFDENGILFALGSNFGKMEYSSKNAVDLGMIEMKSTRLETGNVTDFIKKGKSDDDKGKYDDDVWPCTKNKKNAFFSLSLKHYKIKPSAYVLRSCGSLDNYLRTWNFEASNDGKQWTLLKQHKSDYELYPGNYESKTWKLKNVNSFYSHFRIRMANTNKDLDWKLQCSGFEIYGDLMIMNEETALKSRASIMNYGQITANNVLIECKKFENFGKILSVNKEDQIKIFCAELCFDQE